MTQTINDGSQAANPRRNLVVLLLESIEKSTPACSIPLVVLPCLRQRGSLPRGRHFLATLTWELQVSMGLMTPSYAYMNSAHDQYSL